MTVIPELPQQTKDAYNTIRAGGGLVNPNASFVASINSRFSDIKTGALAAMPQTPDLIDLADNIDTLLVATSNFLSHTNFIVSDSNPSGANEYNFYTRTGILQAIINIVDTGFDLSDTDTVEDKKNKYFGSVQDYPIVQLTNLDSIADALEQAIVDNTLSAEAAIQNPLILSNASGLNSRVSLERSQPSIDIQRLKDFGYANTLYNMTNRPDQAVLYEDLLNNVLSNGLKQDYGWNP